MTFNETMSTLKKLGTAQAVKIYKRHGGGDNVFGVSFANLYKLQKQIKCDHALAMELWTSGNLDARFLATLIADPAKLTAEDAESWLTDPNAPALVGEVSKLFARAPFAKKKMVEWMRVKEDPKRSCGYSLLGCALTFGGVEITDAECAKILETIEKEIHASPNRARLAMNNALIAIGGYRPALTAKALAAAKRIGHVEVDHGETGCKTPVASEYIPKMLARAKKRKVGC